jgi:serine-type D-Ala-D-Ala carboxypeptidase (penicillin-binding protein 5/6)
MIGSDVLRPAARRRRRRPRTWPWLAAVAVVALVIVFLGVMAPAVSDQRARLPRPAPKRAEGRRPRSLYALGPAPRAERVNATFKLALPSGLLFFVRTGAVLGSRDPTRILPIASLTKMMTALVVTDRAPPSARVLITPAAVHYTGSGVGLLPLGKRVSLETLLYGLLLPSGNDAAIALAQHVAGTEGAFIALMNARARRMGLRCTHFASVSGIVDLGNFSCAIDLAAIAHAVLEQRLLAKIVASPSAILPFPIKGGKLFLYNNNPLLRLRYPGTDGVKTGFTDAAGPCLVAAARRGRVWLGVVLLHSGDPSDQAQKLLYAAFAKLRAPPT